ASAATMVSTMAGPDASGKNQTPVPIPTLSAGNGETGVLAADLGTQSESVGDPIDVVVVSDEVIQVEDVQVVQAHRTQPLHVRLVEGGGRPGDGYRVGDDGVEARIAGGGAERVDAQVGQQGRGCAQLAELVDQAGGAVRGAVEGRHHVGRDLALERAEARG